MRYYSESIWAGRYKVDSFPRVIVELGQSGGCREAGLHMGITGEYKANAVGTAYL